MSERQEHAQKTLIVRYGDERTAILRTLNTWFSLTLLLVFGWPAVVFFTNAPALQPRYMSNGWFLVRLLITLIVFLLVVRFWRSSGISGKVARYDVAMALFHGSWVRQQVTLFFVGTTGILAMLLLGSATGPALRILILGLAGALAVQSLIAGYVRGVLEELDTNYWTAFLVTTGLFVVTFAIRSVVAEATSVGGPDRVLTVLVSGVVVGAVVGVLSIVLRDRMESLFPGILAQWLLLTIIPAFI